MTETQRITEDLKGFIRGVMEAKVPQTSEALNKVIDEYISCILRADKVDKLIEQDGIYGRRNTREQKS